jgi:PAS domain S-box-containing protein
MNGAPKTGSTQTKANAELRRRLEEAEETLRAIRAAEVDALVMGEKVYTIEGAETPYRILVEAMHEGAATLGPDGTILYCNSRLAGFLGTPLEHLIGTSLRRFFDPADVKSFDAMLTQSRQGPCRGEISFRNTDGSPTPAQIALSTLETKGTRAVCLVASDLTERKQAEEALRHAHDSLEQRVHERTRELGAAKAVAEAANRAKSQFLANVSHELRTPMNAILGMIDVALSKSQEPHVQDCLQTAKESADLLLALLNDLLDSAKIESGKLELESAPFSLRRLLEQTASVLSVRARQKGLSLSCHIRDDLPQMVVGDRTRLQQVLLNLAGNAIKFTPRGKVEIRTRAVGGADRSPLSTLHPETKRHVMLEFAVQDTGIGIPQADLGRVFQPFVQADASTARRFGGSGLGLSITKSLVELMGGRIWVESKWKNGSTFYFTVRLPLQDETPSHLETAPVLGTRAGALLHILLAEDNPANQKLATYVLAGRGHVVDLASDGHEAIRLSGQNRYDIILMDVQMPGMDGLEATAAIRKREGDEGRVPIIAMTAHAMKGDRERCLAGGMDAYLGKPINAQEMISLVESLAAKSRHP